MDTINTAVCTISSASYSSNTGNTITVIIDDESEMISVETVNNTALVLKEEGDVYLDTYTRQ